MDKNDKNKAEKAHLAMKGFVDQFGPNDLCKEALIDVLLEAIYDQPIGDDLDLPGEKGQEDDSHSNDGGGREMPTYEIE